MDEQERKLVEELLFSGEKKPSFAKMLYFGVFDAERVFPYPTVNQEEKGRVDKFLSKLNPFIEKQIDPDWIDRNAKIPEEVIAGLGKLGLLGMTIPEQYGGLGMSQHGYCRSMERLAGRCASTALFVNAHQSIGLKAILLFGTEKQRMQWLPKLSSGEYVAAFSLTEPNAGSDANGIETLAVYDPFKKVYRINGRKQWTTNGSIADVLTVMARTAVDTPEGRQNKVTAFLVTPDMPGFKISEAALEKVGMRGTKTTNLIFENMEVPEENVLGPLGGGLKVCLTALDYGRTTFGATCTGIAKELLERGVNHAKNRMQFKRPLASFALVKQKIANMSALVYAMDATMYLTAGLVDRGQDDVMLESAMLKVFASDALWSVLYDTMQILGGRSFFTDQPYERMMRDARLNMIGEGSNEVMRAFIGAVGMRDVGMQLKGVLDACKSPVSEFGTLWAFGRHCLRRIPRPVVPVHAKILEAEAKALGSAVRRFGLAIPRVLARYREEVVERQLELDRLATSAMAIYTTTAVLSKLDADLTRVGGDVAALGNDVAVAKFYCKQAMQSVDRSLGSLFSKDDSVIEALSDQISGIKRK